jgi:hypothetical protein
VHDELMAGFQKLAGHRAADAAEADEPQLHESE